MPAAKPLHIRQEIVTRRERGETFVAIAATMQLSYDTVRNIWRHWQAHGRLQPNYEACSQPGPRKAREMWETALTLKREHPRWGAVVIREHLKAQFTDNLPSERTLQVWFRQAGLNRTSRVQRRKSVPVKRGQVAHEVWAVDAKELIALAKGQRVSWLTVTDEASGAILNGQVFPPGEMDQARSAPGA